jgi:hypothetical protein
VSLRRSKFASALNAVANCRVGVRGKVILLRLVEVFLALDEVMIAR